MGRPRRAGEPASHLLQIRLTTDELAALDAQRLPDEARSAAARRLIGRGSPPVRPDPAKLLRSALLRLGVEAGEAERVLRLLADRIAAGASLAELMREAVAAGRRPGVVGAKTDLLVGTLQRMGVGRDDAERAIAALGARVETEPLTALVGDALRHLSMKEE